MASAELIHDATACRSLFTIKTTARAAV